MHPNSFLERKWSRETHYRLRKELFSFTSNRIAVQFWYEYLHPDDKVWRRCYGLEHWTFAEDGRMQKRQMSGNEVTLEREEDRWFKDGVGGEEAWDQVVLPDGHF